MRISDWSSECALPILQWATQLAAKAPLAIALTKRVARQSQTSGLAEMLGVEADLQSMCYASEDSREARNAFIERSEEHTSELQSLMRISYAVFCLKKKKKINTTTYPT